MICIVLPKYRYNWYITIWYRALDDVCVVIAWQCSVFWWRHDMIVMYVLLCSLCDELWCNPTRTRDLSQAWSQLCVQPMCHTLKYSNVINLIKMMSSTECDRFIPLLSQSVLSFSLFNNPENVSFWHFLSNSWETDQNWSFLELFYHHAWVSSDLVNKQTAWMTTQNNV